MQWVVWGESGGVYFCWNGERLLMKIDLDWFFFMVNKNSFKWLFFTQKLYADHVAMLGVA